MKSKTNPFLASALAALALASHAPAAVLYWDGAGAGDGGYNGNTSWATAADGVTDPAGAPGINDDAVFSITSIITARSANLQTSTAKVNSWTFNGPGSFNFYARNGARTFTLGAGGITLNPGAGAVTINGPGTNGSALTLLLNANQTWTNNSSNALTFSSNYGGSNISTNGKALVIGGSGNTTVNQIVTGTGSLQFSGTGAATLTLAGSNDYTGDTRVSGGTLALGNVGALSATSLDMNSGDSGVVTFTVAGTNIYNLGGLKGTRDLSIGANSLSVGATNLSSSYGGILSGTGGLTKQGAGTLSLSGPNTYEGATTVTAGSLVFQNTASKPPLSAISVSAGATLGLGVGTAPDYFADTEIAGLFANTLVGVSMAPDSNVGIDTTVGDYTCASNLAAGAKGLTKLGANTLTLTGTNAYAGPISINSGALQISASNHLGDATQPTNTITLGAATLRSSANTYDLGMNRSIALTGAATIQVDAGALTVSGNVTGANSLTKFGAGTLILSGSNNYSGETVMGNGTVRVDSASGLGTTSRVRFINGNGILNNNSGGLLTIAGLASNINSSAQQITGGELLVTGLAENVQNTGFGGFTFNNTKTTLAGGLKLSIDGNRNFTINGSSEVIVSGNVQQAGTNSTLVYTGAGAGSLTLAGTSNTHSGGVLLNSGTLNVNSPTAFGTSVGAFRIAGGTLDNTSASAITIANNNPVTINGDFIFTGTRDLALGPGAVSLGTAAGTARTITVNAGNLTFGGVISDGTTASGLIKTGAGTLTLTAASTYSGDTTVSEGTLNLGNGTLNTSLADNANVFVESGAVLNLNYSGTDTVKELWVNGLQKAPGVYEAVGSPGSGIEIPEITGGGTLTVNALSAYDTWATNPPYNLTGPSAAFGLDYDNDGLDNGLEWILGGDPTQNDNPSILPTVTGSASNGITLVFNRTADSLPPASTLVVDFDSDLDATWAKSVTIGATSSGPDANGVSVAVDTPTAGKITVTIPASNAVGGKLFSRLRAVKP